MQLRKVLFITLLICSWGLTVQAQIYIKSEYIPSSSFKNENGDKFGGKNLGLALTTNNPLYTLLFLEVSPYKQVRDAQNGHRV